MGILSKNIIDFEKGEKVEGFYLVKSCQVRTSNKGGEYASIFLGDQTAEIQGMVWDIKPEDAEEVRKISPGDVIKIRGLVNEYNGSNQLKINKFRKQTPEDDVDMSELVPSAPMTGKHMFGEIRAAAESIADSELRELTLTLMDENKDRLEYFPAASKNHHAVRGGLLYHVYRMLKSGLALCDIYPVLRRDYIVTGVILHDIAKIFEIDSNEMGVAGSYTMEGELLGHIVQGIKLVDETCKRLGVSDEKRIAVEHMLLSHHYEPEFGSPKKPMFAEAEMLHHLDMIDARMYDMEKALKGVEAGCFSEKIWSLDNRRIYQLSD